MKDFLGMVRDTLPIDNPVGTWQYGRNMVSNKKEKTVSNEYGFSFDHLINGTIIGIIATTSDIVYFSKNDDGTDEIGVVNTEANTPVYETKIKSSLFNFQYTCPIEGIFIYNFKRELIVAWADGIKADSNKPYLINLDNPPVKLDVNKELINSLEFTKLFMFPNQSEATMVVDIVEGSKLGNNVEGAYITYAYAFDEDNILPFFSTSHLKYLNELGVRHFTPTINFTNLDSNFNKIQIGIVLKLTDGTLQGYSSYIIDYTSTSLYLVINSLDNYTETAVEDIIVNKITFNKINTLTKQNSQIHIGNVELQDSIKFQKYANLLELIPVRFGTSKDASAFKKASLMPDEVYSFYIELQLLDGTYTNAYHIPGRAASGTELTNVTSSQASIYGIPSQLQNRAQFYVFNNGNIDGTDAGAKFGYWQNEEDYPDIEDFNSTLDYDNQTLNGEDLRNTPIRYHRVPSKENLGYTYGNYGDNSGESENYNIGIKVINFDTAIPTSIKNQIQGYRISFVKRTLNNSLVLGNLIMTNRYQIFQGGGDGQINAPQTHPWSITYNTSLVDADWQKVAFFGKELNISKPSLNPNYVRINHFRNVSSSVNGRFVRVNINVKYRDVSPIVYAPNNNFDEGTAFREELAYGTLTNTIPNNGLINAEEVDNGLLDVTLISNNKRVYQGFKSNDLVIIGKTNDVNTPAEFEGGDVFLNEFSINTSQPGYSQTDNRYGFFEEIVKSPLYSPFNNVNFLVKNTPPSFEDGNNFSDLDPFFGVVADDSIYNNATSTLETTGTTITVINDITTILTDNFISNSTNIFPYRIFRSLKVANESLSISSFRSFLANNYYEMPNDKGEIIALRGIDKKLYIQLKYSLFIATIKDVLQTGTTLTYVGQADLFEYLPKEVLIDEKGIIGCISKFACVFIKGMYIVVNALTGQIFIVDNGVKEISKEGNRHWFRNNWRDTKGIDNPYINYGFLIGYDKEFNRLLFIKKDYEYDAFESLSTFDGEFYISNYDGSIFSFTDEPQLSGNSPIANPELRRIFKNNSKTLSFSLDKNTWQFEHDYFPNYIFHTHNNLYSGVNKLSGVNRCSIYKHNNPDLKGVYYGNVFSSYIDIIFNQNLNITKLYQSIHWITTVINGFKGTEQFKTINQIMLYNDSQCSGIITFSTDGISPQRTRNNEWFFNDFRDIVEDENLPIINDNGEVVATNLNNLKVWFEKSNFISKFIVVRLIINNNNNEDVFIHQVNVKSQISK